MRLTMRDVAATLLVLIGLAFAYSVVAGWGWPLMNGARAGIIALFAVSFVACPLSWRTSDAGAFFRSPFFVVGAIAGVLLLAVSVIGLFVGTLAYLELTMAGVVVMVVITLLHRLLPDAGSPRTAAG